MKRVFALSLAVSLFVPAIPAEATPESNFGRMFAIVEKSAKSGALSPLNQQTNEQLKMLAAGMKEVGATNNPDGTMAGITFFGQFIDHDLTLDTQPQPAGPVNVEGLLNARSFPFDL